MKIKTITSIVTAVTISLVLSTTAKADTFTEVKVQDTLPWLWFDDSDDAGNEWLIRGYTDYFRIYDYQTSGGNDSPAFSIDHSANSIHSFAVDTSGDINLADGSVFIDRSTNRLGIGTTTPTDNLSVVGSIKQESSTGWSIKHLASGSGIVGAAYDNTTLKGFPYIMNLNTKTNLTWVSDKDQLSVGNAAPSSDAAFYVSGDIESAWSGSDTANNHNLLAISTNNAGSGSSDVGFSMENKETNFKWTFRTYAPTEGFAASKIGTGGTEFQVDNTGASIASTVVKMGGVTVFESGHLVTASSRSLKTDIKPLDREAALDAFHKLQPVSYAYKAHKDEPVVGFIAEDVPELVAMPSRKSIDSTEIVAVLTKVVQEQDTEIKAMKAEIAELKMIKQKVSMMESILSNLAMDISNNDQKKVSMK